VARGKVDGRGVGGVSDVAGGVKGVDDRGRGSQLVAGEEGEGAAWARKVELMLVGCTEQSE
jgi:hypothetical protein